MRRRRSSSTTLCMASGSPRRGSSCSATAATTGSRPSAGDGTFVREYQVLKDSPPGTVGSGMLWPDAAQTDFVVSDDPNGDFNVIRRSDGVEVSTAGRVGTNLGQFMNLHNLAIDHKGNVYTAEVQGKRVQRFRNLS